MKTNGAVLVELGQAVLFQIFADLLGRFFGFKIFVEGDGFVFGFELGVVLLLKIIFTQLGFALLEFEFVLKVYNEVVFFLQGSFYFQFCF